MGFLGKIGGTAVGDSCIACQVFLVVILLKQYPIYYFFFFFVF